MVGLIRLFAWMSKNKNVSLSEPQPDGVELGLGCIRVDTLAVNAWVQARPCMRRSVPLAAFAESGTSFDGSGDGSGVASPNSSLWVPVYTNSGPALSVPHHKAVRQEGIGSRVTDHAWRTCGNGWRGNSVYHG
jgi:hypothetical protein